MTKSDGSKVREFWVSEHGGGASIDWDGPPNYVKGYYLSGNKVFHVVEHSAYLQEKQARELAEAERDDLKDQIEQYAAGILNFKCQACEHYVSPHLPVYMVSEIKRAHEERDSLKEEVACLRSVLSEFSHETLAHYSQWHCANQLADERSKREPKYIYTIEEGPA